MSLDKFCKIQTLVFSLFIIFVVVFTFNYVLPDVEEYYLSIVPRDLGVYKFVKFFGIEFSGRYTSNFLGSIHPLVFFRNFFLYKLSLLFLLIFFVSSVYLFVVNFLTVNILEAIVHALFFVSMYLMVSPSLFMSLYFLSGAYVYLLPSIFFILNLVLFKKYVISNEVNQFKWFVFLSIVLFLSIGFNEMFLPLYMVLTATLFLYIYIYKRNLFEIFVPIGLISIISISFFIAHPSNFERMGESDFYFSKIFYNSVINFFLALKSYIMRFELLLILIFSYTLRDKIIINLKESFYILIIMIIITYLMSVPFYMRDSFNQNLEPKIYNPIVFLQYFVLMFLVFPVFWHFISKRVEKLNVKTSIAINFVWAIILFNVFIGKNNNIGILINDLISTKTMNYYYYNQDFFSSLINSRANADSYKIIYLNNTVSMPFILYRDTHGTDNRYNSYWNHSIEGYFNLNEVRVRKSKYYKFHLCPK